MQFAKHIHVLNLLSQIPGVVVGQSRRNESMTVEQANDCWDHLFTYIHAHWAEPLSAMQGKDDWERCFTSSERSEIMDCQAMLKMNWTELETKLASLPPYFSEVVFPVAVARYLLLNTGGIALPMHHRKCTTFGEFHRRYGAMILND